LKKEVLSIRVGGRSIAEVTRGSVKEALDFVNHLELSSRSQKISQGILKEIQERLRFMMEVGLDYLTLDRTATLLWWRIQRIGLATQIGFTCGCSLYPMNRALTPSRDHLRLLETLKRLRDLGNTVIVVEHDEETIRAADHVIDMGPGPGEKGGQVVFGGSPKALMQADHSLTGQYLSGRLSIPVPEARRSVGNHFLVVRGATANN
jgi:excinuclease ABC subunit A